MRIKMSIIYKSVRLRMLQQFIPCLALSLLEDPLDTLGDVISDLCKSSPSQHDLATSSANM